jgi:hypothetical protein
VLWKALVLVDSSEDERAHSRRYTEDGINVVALDRRGRGLHRARPERRIPSSRITRPFEPVRSWLSTVLFVVLGAVILALAISRFG